MLQIQEGMRILLPAVLERVQAAIALPKHKGMTTFAECACPSMEVIVRLTCPQCMY